MQAQPRGKKRGLKENINAGGKKSKKEEGEEDQKPYVCAIYRRDIASFLRRAKIQQWRQTSSLSNASLIEFLFRLPRFKYHCLRVIFASADRCRVKKDGFLDHQSLKGWMSGKEFNSIYKFRFCCRDVKDSTSKLVGQRLFLNKPDDEGVAFQLCVNWFTKTVVCRVPNLLTKKTAPAMLHFLHHLSQACFECIEIYSRATVDAAECAINPLVLQVLPKFRLRGVRLGPVKSWTAGRANVPRVMVAYEMRIHFNLLYYRSYYNNFVAGLPLLLPHLLDFIANGPQLDKGLVLEGRIGNQEVDQIIKEDVRSLEGAIRDVRCKYFWEDVNWPARCPREAATQVTERDDGTVDYRFDYTNAHSGEPFSLLLGIRRHEGRQPVYKFHLKFGSA